jgi:predicted metal-dependent phosphoesterase TrpH
LIFDLHCHSNCSDGSLSPQELIALAKKLGLGGISITDHDTARAYELAIPAAKKAGIKIGAGIELSCEFQGVSVHILGYDFILSHAAINDLIVRHQKRRQDRNHTILEKLKARGMPIEESEFLAQAHEKSLGRPHIAELMVAKGYVTTVREAFYKYLGENKPCFARGEPFTIGETIDILHAAQGKVFIAHPHLLPKEISWENLSKLPFDGIECFYSRFPKEASQKWLDIAAKHRWLISGGSDFHGAAKPDATLGCSGVDLKSFEMIFQHGL